MSHDTMDIVDRLREGVISDAFACGQLTNGILAEQLILERHEAADEIERLRGVLVEANNRWRHDFYNKVVDAADELSKNLAAHRTDPFHRKLYP